MLLKILSHVRKDVVMPKDQPVRLYAERLYVGASLCSRSGDGHY